MTDPISLAFAHPEARAAALSDDPPPDRISMTEHLREVEIGAFQGERGVTQTIRFDVVVEVATRAETATDDVDRILSYDTIVEAIDAALGETRLNLLETLAARVADLILVHPLARRVFVRIGKLDRGPYVLGVEIVRDAPPDRRPVPVALPDVAHPLVVLLDADAVARPDLGDLLDRLGRFARPVILVAGHARVPAPQAERAMPQWRIDLLALEQAAWVLAARDRRCVVVDSRTELDWAMKHGRTSVWAPSKMVIDAHALPGGPEADPGRLALWLGGLFSARAVLGFGAGVPDGTDDLPVHRFAAGDLPPDDFSV